MGIDPNNHRLNQIPPIPFSQPKCVSPAATSSHESMNNNESSKPLIKPFANTTTADRVSDTTSGVEDEISGSLDLNLDLTIAGPSASSLTLVQEKLQISSKSIVTKEMTISEQVPTLVLFR